MLDTDTKRRIDTARDILVGKVPDPKSQVEQITIALIYKFMDDMDAEAEEFGGKRKFFAGEFGRYGWAKLMRSGLGGHETLNLYAEAIAKMPENPGIPPLFRDIFKNAFLPYRDPETLRMFLKVIDEFTYDHSEKLGDAFEYLLSVMSAQGDAGQFRTPRHIIDFIVEIVDPKKGENILDPACGTAGFLISSYKHILKANTDADGHSTLTPDEKGRLAGNLKGYDISPDMVRLSLVNMYLHDFSDPHIYEYDTLTSLDRWNEYADVILANPPFMSPKGGIKPHNRFSVQSKRSEVLFVDYMAEHLTPNGRAGIIVPEGIIFQSQNAYKQLRKTLVEECLVAVVSLPAGVFNPYSGVKTSILILDKSLAKKANTIAFFKVENDGFGLGAQRREIDKNDLPQVLAETAEYLRRLRAGESVEPSPSGRGQGEGFQPMLGLVVAKEKVGANGEYNLTAERYGESDSRTAAFPTVPLGEVCELVRGVTYERSDEVHAGGLQVLRANNIAKDTSSLDLSDVKRVSAALTFSDDKKLRKDDIFICLASGSKDHIGKVAFITENTDYYFGGFMGAVRAKRGRLDPRFLFELLRQTRFNDFLRAQIAGANINNLGASLLYRYKIPLPPLEVQKEIVAEIEGYQKVINGARAVLDNYRPHIPINPDWPMVAIGELCVVERGASPRPIHDFITDAPDGVNWVKIGDAEVGAKYITQTKERITPEGAAKSRRVKPGDFVLSNSMSFGRPYVMAIEGCIHDGWLLLRDTSDNLDRDFLYCILASSIVLQQFERAATGGVVNNLNSKLVRNVTIPLPPLATQQAIVAEIEAEQALVNANRELITRMEKKIQATIARVWGD